MTTKGMPLTSLLLILALAATAAETPSVDELYRDWFRKNAVTLSELDDLAPFYRAVGERRFVLLGESTHGTHEYYYWRKHISRHLIEHKGFRFIGVEGDWENIYRLNQYVKHHTDDETSARDLMLAMERWPQWMWANEEFESLIEWLRQYNEPLEAQDRVGVFGLDMQDPEDSVEAVINWFTAQDSEQLPAVRAAYGSILDFPETFRGYAQHLAQGGNRLDEAVRLPVELLRQHQGDKSAAQIDKALWAAKQNALAVKRAEAQFHASARGPREDSWNLRASHMEQAFWRIAQRYGDNSRGIVWAHNTHVGDARATDMRNRNEVNIGQLLRESAGMDQVFILGFATHSGKVMAGQQWGGARQTIDILPAQRGSLEYILNKSEIEQALFLFDDQFRSSDDFLVALNHRAIGVIYRPPHEAYVPSIVPWRYDALLYIDSTEPLTPLHRNNRP